MAIGLLVFLSFAPVLHNDFVDWDDPANFTDNPGYRGLSLSHLKWMFTAMHMGHYQPLTWLSHALVYSVWGMDPFGYHLVNLLLHMGNAVAFYFLIAALLREVWGQGQATQRQLYAVAAIGALLFAIHPLRVESVAWATERRQVLCSFFLLLSVLAYMRRHDAQHAGSATARTWFLVSIGCYGLSLLAEAMGLTLPVILLVLDCYPLRRLGMQTETRVVAGLLIEKIPYAALAAGATALAMHVQGRFTTISLAQRGLTARLLQAAYGLRFYLWKTVVPTRLSPLYILREPLSPSDPTLLLSIVTVVVVTIAMILWRQRYPWLLASWVCYVVLVSPNLGFFPSGPQIAADRYTYLSCLPWAVLAAAGALRLWQTWESRRFGWATRLSPLAGIVVLLTMLGVSTHAQTRLWSDSLTLWSHAVQIDPNSLAYNNRGVARLLKRDLDGALADFNQSLDLDANNLDARNNRGEVRQAKGDLEGALADYGDVLRVNPEHASAYVNRGSVRQAQGDVGGALVDYDTALRLNPDHTKALNNRGSARLAQGNVTAAIADFNHALDLDPDNAETYSNRAKARRMAGDLNGALADYDEALRLRPDYSKAYNNRGHVRQAKGDLNGALVDFNAALRFNPDYPNAYVSRGSARQLQGDLAGAADDFTTAIHLSPSDADLYFSRANVRIAQRDLDGAIADYNRAIELAPPGAPSRGLFQRGLAAAQARAQAQALSSEANKQ